MVVKYVVIIEIDNFGSCHCFFFKLGPKVENEICEVK